MRIQCFLYFLILLSKKQNSCKHAKAESRVSAYKLCLFILHLPRKQKMAGKNCIVLVRTSFLMHLPSQQTHRNHSHFVSFIGEKKNMTCSPIHSLSRNPNKPLQPKIPPACTKRQSSTPADQASEAAAAVSTMGVARVLVEVGARR